ncbi:hypothetical protein Save01_08338 [Streptomyces avermitilis]
MRPTTPVATPDHGAGRGVPEVTCNSNKRSNTGMDVTDFPDDLVQTQDAWNATYQALAAHRPRETTALRRRLLLLFVRLWWHPYWGPVPSVPAAQSELRHLARVHGAVRAA